MWPVSQRFLQAIPKPHKIGGTITCTLPGGSPQPLLLVSGQVQVQGDQNGRRTASVAVSGGSALYDTLSAPGATFRISHGIMWSNLDFEFVPMITGRLSAAARQLGDGLVSLTIGDYWQDLDAQSYVQAYSPATTSRRTAEIATAVTGAVHGATVTNTSSDTGTVSTEQTWSSRAELVNGFATDGGTEAFFGPDGNFIIRDEPQVTGSPVWSVRPGDGGTLTDLQRNRPLDKLYNTVVVTPASTDSSQTWTAVTVQVTDTSNPRHPNYIGVRPYPWAAPTLMTASQAVAAGKTLLNRLMGATESFSLGAISNPALEAGDVITITSPADVSFETVTHLVSGLTVDLVSGAMTIDTRSSSEAVS